MLIALLEVGILEVKYMKMKLCAPSGRHRAVRRDPFGLRRKDAGCR